MKTRLSKVGVIAVLAVFVLGIFPVSPVSPSTLSTTRIYMAPSKIVFDPSNGTIGTLFNITMRVEDVKDLASFQICIVYNDTIINVTRWFEPTWDPEYVFKGKTTLPVPFPPQYIYEHIGSGNGSAMVGVALFPGPPPGGGFTGSGKLCIFEFKITAVPPPSKTYSCTLYIDRGSPYDTYLLDSIGNDIPATEENGYYKIVGVPIEKLSTMVYFNLNPNPAKVGETVTLKGILVDEFSQPLASETVKLYGRPLAGSWRYVTSLTTNAYGIFTWQAKIPIQGTFIFAVYYPGSEAYESCYNFAILIVQPPS